MAEILRFDFNVPVEVALKYATGKDVEGRYGPQVMYSLVDGRVMYVDPLVADRITDLEIGAGERFSICKRERKDGRKKGVEWAICRVDPKADFAGADAVTSAPLAVAAQVASSSQTSPDPSTQLAAFIDHNALILTGFLCASIDACENARRYAAERNLAVEFNEEDFRSLASTLYIQAAKGGAKWAQ
jgi:hypothetical protein